VDAAAVRQGAVLALLPAERQPAHPDARRRRRHRSFAPRAWSRSTSKWRRKIRRVCCGVDGTCSLSLNNNHGHPTVAALPQRRTGARGLFEAFCASLLPTRTPLMGPFSLRPESDRNALTHYSSRQYRSGPSGLSGYRHEVIVTCPQLL
jgi:hypothetical protein